MYKIIDIIFIGIFIFHPIMYLPYLLKTWHLKVIYIFCTFFLSYKCSNHKILCGCLMFAYCYPKGRKHWMLKSKYIVTKMVIYHNIFFPNKFMVSNTKVWNHSFLPHTTTTLQHKHSKTLHDIQCCTTFVLFLQTQQLQISTQQCHHCYATHLCFATQLHALQLYEILAHNSECFIFVPLACFIMDTTMYVTIVHKRK